MDIAMNIVDPSGRIEGVLLQNKLKGQVGGTRHGDKFQVMKDAGRPRFDSAGTLVRETIAVFDLEWHYTPIRMADGKDEFDNPKSFSVGDYVCLLARDPVPDWVWEQPGLVRFKDWPT